MSGKGELVEYTREFGKHPLSAQQKANLKAQINGLIDGATGDITIEVMIKASHARMQEELKKPEKK